MHVPNTLEQSLASVNTYCSFTFGLTTIMKLINKVKDVMSTDLEGISNQTVSEPKKLLAETTLAHLKQKKGQIPELDNAIGAKIEAAQHFEEITNADTYQTTL